MSPASPLLELRGIHKSFIGVPVLGGVDFDLRRGEVHALVGENGAGKSTLIKIIAGIHQPSAGVVLIDGAAPRPHSPRVAAAAGIVVIHQEFSTLPELTVAENIFIGRQPRNCLGLVSWRRMRERARALLQDLAIALDPDARVGELSVADRQMVEIAKALARDARAIIFDEPTAVISGREAAMLFDRIRQLRARGVGVVYISHRLDEIFELADRVTVLKDGTHVSTDAVTALDHDAVVSRMVGRPLRDIYPPRRRQRGERVLELDRIRLERIVEEGSLALHRGEIVGLAGMAGAGRTELALGIFGGLRLLSGAMALKARPWRPAGPAEALAAGVAYLTEDRKNEGLFLGQKVSANITAATLERLARRRLLDLKAEDALARQRMQDLRVRAAGPAQRIGTLSGGNQQKALIARLLEARPEILLLDEPTRGIDIGAKVEIYRLIAELAGRGVAILLISSELGEVIGLSDRILVMREGRIAGELAAEGATEEAIVSLATRRPAETAA
jgi:ribose transport system ATP-binding protein